MVRQRSAAGGDVVKTPLPLLLLSLSATSTFLTILHHLDHFFFGFFSFNIIICSNIIMSQTSGQEAETSSRRDNLGPHRPYAGGYIVKMCCRCSFHLDDQENRTYSSLY